MYCMERDKARALWEQSRRIVDVMVRLLSIVLILDCRGMSHSGRVSVVGWPNSVHTLLVRSLAWRQ